MIGRFIYQLFVTSFVVAFEIATYLAVWIIYLRPAQDVYLMHCGADGVAGDATSCAPFHAAVLGLTIVEAVVATTATVGLIMCFHTVYSGIKNHQAKSAEVAEDNNISK
ncbi:MAG: hypothetical protein WCI47_00065 [bacterium]